MRVRGGSRALRECVRAGSRYGTLGVRCAVWTGPTGCDNPHVGDDEVRLEPPRSVGNRLPASETVTLHELSHHVPGRA